MQTCRSCALKKRIIEIAEVSANSSRFNSKMSVDLQQGNGFARMTRNELIYAVAYRADMTRIAAACAVGATFDTITAALKTGGEVKIIGFGHFKVIRQAARDGRHPRTGAPIEIKAAMRPRFLPSRGLRDAVKTMAPNEHGAQGGVTAVTLFGDCRCRP